MFSMKLENDSGRVVDINDGKKYIVLAVSGLNPPPASIFTAKSPNRKGVKYNGSTLDARSIVITLKILGDIEANRNALYEWIDTEQYCKVYFKNGAKDVYIEGHVEDCDVDLFTDNEIINLAILCEDPYFKDMQKIVTEISAVLKQFAFPFSISHDQTVTYSSPNPDGSAATATRNRGVPFSTISESNVTNVFNAGAETGAKIVIRCVGEVKDLCLYDANDTSRQFQINYTFPAGWFIVIDTDASPKTCKGYPPNGGDPVNLLRYLGNIPTWFTLRKGVNAFVYTVDGASASAEITFNFENKYLGV